MSNVAALRIRCGLTQRELADMVGVTEATVRNWENDRSGGDWFERLARLCNALNCNPDDLLRSKIVGGEDGEGTNAEKES